MSSSQVTGGRISRAEEHSVSTPADNAGKYGASEEIENYPAHDESIESQSVWETRGSSSKEIYGKAFERHGSSREAIFGGTSEHAASSPMSRGNGNGKN
ncbi:unnamed protein product [Anisakis simplex]|uniref:General stress protein n=1 Tax=Anisakis simplex TaxID=6269 RepID=A0A0M3JBG6_ANISI|nr:unnamed protein product [Anisakis simplex]